MDFENTGLVEVVGVVCVDMWVDCMFEEGNQLESKEFNTEYFMSKKFDLLVSNLRGKN